MLQFVTEYRSMLGSSRYVARISLSLLLAGVSACSSEQASELMSRRDGRRAEISHIGRYLIEKLDESANMRGRTWNVSHDNRFAENWLVSTPSRGPWGQPSESMAVVPPCTVNCEADFELQRCQTQSDCAQNSICQQVLASVKRAGERPLSMCVGHSDDFVDEIYTLITSGETFVDIASLQPPDGRFLAAIRNAITYLSYKANPPDVRLLFGSIPVGGLVNTKKLVSTLTRDAEVGSPIRVSVGAMRSSNAKFSWNHAKIIAVDGKEALVGGHNLWSKHYLKSDPVHDLSMRVSGTAAGDAHKFANELWDYTCKTTSFLTSFTGSVTYHQKYHGKIERYCPPAYALDVANGEESATVISVGRLADGIAQNGNQSDDALLGMIDAAQSTVRMSLQDIGPLKVPTALGKWPEKLLASLGDALQRGVDIYVVVSNKNAQPGGLGSIEADYSNGWAALDVAISLRNHMSKRVNFVRGDSLRDLICTKFHIAPLRYSESLAWPSGALFANHVKSFVVDDQAFYIGSHNLYPSNLQEFGYIVDDSEMAKSYMSKYWDKAWAYSRFDVVTGVDARSCAL